MILSLYVAIDFNEGMEFSKSRQYVMMVRRSGCMASAPELLQHPDLVDGGLPNAKLDSIETV